MLQEKRCLFFDATRFCQIMHAAQFWVLHDFGETMQHVLHDLAYTLHVHIQGLG